MIRVEHLSKAFGTQMVLSDVCIDIRKGETISIIGPSGTGKSTFLRCLNLLETPSGGKIFIDGQELAPGSSNIVSLRRKMGMVFQNFNLFNHLTVLGNLTIGPVRLLKHDPRQAKEHGRELLRMVGLSDKEDALPEELSGGQKQRIAIARCLSMYPEIILLDEPTSALDPTMVSEVLGVIRRLNKEGMTMAIVTHEMKFARDVSDRILYMDQGMVYESGTPGQIFDHPQKELTRAFIHRIRNFHFHIDDDRYDMYAMNGEIETYCRKHIFSERRTNNILLLTEELLELCFEKRRPAQLAHERSRLIHQTGGLDLRINYFEADNVLEVALEADALLGSLLGEAPDPISISIVNGLTSSVGESAGEGRLSATWQLRAE